MGKVITIANQKGGVGKTITATSMAAILTEKGYKILNISLDPQRNFDMIAGKDIPIKRMDVKTLSMLHVMRGSCTISEAIVPTGIGDLARASSQLYQWSGEQIIAKEEYIPIRDDLGKLQELLDMRVLHGEDNTAVLAERLAPVKDSYDYILIDTNPSLTLLTLNSLFAADYVVIPAFSEESSVTAITELWDTIQVMNYINKWHKIKVLGILMTKCNIRTTPYKHYEDLFKLLAERMGTRLFATRIRQSTRATDCMEYNRTLIEHDPKGPTTADYREFIDEFEKIMKEEVD